jgi:hypothetical protein
MGKRVFICAVIAFAALSASAVTTKDMAAGITVEQLAAALTGAGITITNVKVTGAQNAIGTFTGGSGDGLSIDGGVIMSSGDIKNAVGPNTNEGSTTSLATAGDVQLDNLVAPLKTHDAIIIEFDAVTVSNSFSIRYVFASEEYKEFVGSQFNDVFAFFVDGQNIAIVPGTSQPVAVNTINQIQNSGLYNDNPAFSLGPPSTASPRSSPHSPLSTRTRRITSSSRSPTPRTRSSTRPSFSRRAAFPASAPPRWSRR